jgi:hypothetical protein
MNPDPDFASPADVIADLLASWQTDDVPGDVTLGERHPVVRSGQRSIIPRELRRLIWHRDGGRCQICGAGRVQVQLDHIVPWSAGGADSSSNLRLLCAPCNKTRSNYRTAGDAPAIPITRACDPCIRRWVLRYGYTRFGCIIPGNPELTVFCGNCMDFAKCTDPARLM